MLANAPRAFGWRIRSPTGGGGAGGISANRVTDNYGTVGGGYSNRAGDNAGALYEIAREKDREIDELRARLSKLESRSN